MGITDVTNQIFRFLDISDVSRFGAIAQLVEHLHGMQGVRSSSLLGSIIILTLKTISFNNIALFFNDKELMNRRSLRPPLRPKKIY